MVFLMHRGVDLVEVEALSAPAPRVGTFRSAYER
jgi:hypothetical protein